MGNNGNEVHQLIGDTFIKRVSSDGGDLKFQTSGVNEIVLTHDGTISASGFISASSFSGDGSGLTNVTATPSAGTISSSLQNLGNITGSNISASGELSADTIVVGSTLTHIGDSNTKITFDTDDINLTVAGKTAIDLTYDGDGGGDTREITFNEGHADIDVRIEGDTDANLFFTDAGNEKVGIGTNSPGEKLEVIGNISASGTITALSSNIITINGGFF